MGLTHIDATFRKHDDSPTSETVELLVDSGAVYSVVPGDVLHRLGIAPKSEQVFTLANGERISREIGDAYIEYNGHSGYTKVIFGEEGDSNLLGVVTLEVLGLVLDPLKRQLRPLPMLLM